MKGGTPVRLALTIGLRVILPALLLYFAWLGTFYGFGGAEEGTSIVDPYWVFFSSLLLSAACVWSAVLVALEWTYVGQPVRFASRVWFAWVAVLLIAAVLVVVPAVSGPAAYYEGSSVAGYPAEWLGSVAVVLAANAIALVIFFLWPRIRR